MISVVLGFWQDRPPLEALATAALADDLGYPELWIGEMATFDAFALATAVGTQTTRVALAVGPLAVHVRTPAGLAMGTASVAELIGRPVHLALGTSSDVVVSRWHGRPRTRPAATLGATAAAVAELLAGGRVDGYRLRLPPVATGLSIAAFGAGAVEVAAAHAERMLLNMVTVEAAGRFRVQLDAAADRLGRPRPRLAVWLAAAVEPTPEGRRQLVHGYINYLAAPGYGEMFTAAGFGALVASARGGAHPRDLAAAVPDSIADAVALVGDLDAVAARIAAYRAVGVDEVCVVPATAGDPGGERTLCQIADLEPISVA